MGCVSQISEIDDPFSSRYQGIAACWSSWEVNPRPSEVWEADNLVKRSPGMSGKASRMKFDSANGYVQCYWSEKTSPLPWKTNMQPKNGGLEDWKIRKRYSFSIGVVFKGSMWIFRRAIWKTRKSRVIFKNNFSFCMPLCPKHHDEIKSTWHHVIPSPIITPKAAAPARGSREGSPISAKRAKVMTKTFHKAALTSKKAPFRIFQHLSTKGDVYETVPETNIAHENRPSQEKL